MALVHFRPRSEGTFSEAIENALKARMRPFDQLPHPCLLWYQQLEDPSQFYLFLPANSPPVQGQSDVHEPARGCEIATELSLEFDLIAEEIIFDAHEIHMQYDAFPFDAPVMAIGRHTIQPQNVRGFEETFDEVKRVLEEFTGEPMARAWRRGLKAEEPRQQFYLFSGWESEQRHLVGFPQSEGFKEWKRLLPFVEVLEVRHARLFWRSED